MLLDEMRETNHVPAVDEWLVCNNKNPNSLSVFQESFCFVLFSHEKKDKISPRCSCKRKSPQNDRTYCIHSFIHSFIQIVQNLSYLPISYGQHCQKYKQSCQISSIHPSIHPPIHPFIHPSIHSWAWVWCKITFWGLNLSLTLTKMVHFLPHSCLLSWSEVYDL